MVQYKASALTKPVGVGLRLPHISHIAKNHKNISRNIGWFEVHSENYYAINSWSFKKLIEIRQNFPISLHSVGNSLGSAQGINLNHLKKLQELVKIIDPIFVSDHISWGLVNKKHSNDLLPLPYNQEALQTVSCNVNMMQDFLKREILVENPSSYLAFNNSEMNEVDFINQLAKQTGCGFLLDVNNIFVSSENNKNFDPKKYLDEINKNIVKEIHLAGHSKSQIFDGKTHKDILIDTHSDLVCDEVWHLYNYAIKTLGSRPTLMEWDQDIPEFKIFLDEAKKANKILIKNEKKNRKKI